MELFNTGQFWHAHEAWEATWRRKREFASHVFFKGLIQLAAAHHQRKRDRFDGMLTHLERARTKLAPFAPTFLGVRVDLLLASMEAARREALRVGPHQLNDFDQRLVPAIQLASA